MLERGELLISTIEARSFEDSFIVPGIPVNRTSIGKPRGSQRQLLGRLLDTRQDVSSSIFRSAGLPDLAREGDKI